MRLLCALGLFLALLHVTSCLLIGAFNIQQFGDKKSQNKDVMATIKEIVLRYDIILIQEQPKDSWILLTSSPQFDHIVSEPLGLGIHKERYLFLYRKETVSVTDSFQYSGLKPDVFERPPFVVQFSSTETAVEEFVLIPIHTQPDSAVQEIDDLVDVVAAAKQKWKNNNIMVLGDFNADGTYVKDEDWKKIRLFTNKDFHWLIANGVDTTVAAKSSNTYDRIVVTTDMEKGVVAGSAGVFNFKTEYGLPQKKAEKVSDHFPVEVELSKKNKKRKLNPN
ncbi:Deoxyribonuclease-1 [Dissostichus eleginoides]|uniref:Deoxyribonuclease n=1 Tax=Dissostichus eleginoides TaxID=100907 RepID=A0AAD9EQB9_DISEL|nr:Deoxyribonuclease-1 [Dissostichus eleginoides]